MRASRVRLSLVFPAGADPARATAALGGLAGGSRLEYVFEASASNEGVHHCLLVPAAAKASAVATLTGALPGLRVAQAPAPTGRTTLAAKVFLPTPVVLAVASPEAAARTLLSGIAALRPGEQASLKWAARPGSPRRFEPKEPLGRAAREAERAWRGKVAAGVGFQLAGLILVRAGSVARAREITDHMASSLRSRRGAVGSLRITSERGNRSMASLPKTTRSSGWVTAGGEALGLLAWPLGEAIPGVEVGGSRQLAVPRYVPSTGRRLLIGRDGAGNERPVALSSEAARLHLALLGSTGSGKTTVLIRLIIESLAEGIGGVFVDPKDAIETLTDHVPSEYAGRVVVLDASDAGSIPGLDLFGGGDPVMRSDVILSVLKGVSEGWGSRVERFLRLGLRSLQALPDPVLFDWLRLYSEPGLRRAAIARLADPVITAEWRTYESLSPTQQQEYAAPAIARITDLLSRPVLRAVLSQPNPKLDIERLLGEKKWLLVALSPGTLGEPAANLIGGVVTYLVWAAVEKRASIPPDQRRQVMLVLDELQGLSNLPVGIEVAFERFRSLNCAVVAATQAVSRLPERTQQSLLANVGSLLTFRGGAKEAQRLAPELSPLTAVDIAGLARYEVAGRVNTGSLGSGSAVVTGHTEPLPPVTGMGADIRRLSAERYGRDPREIEQELLRRGRDGSGESGEYGRTGRAA
jgi:Helicase HerA, central domain/Type IV secretion-system coupling protein DNA-binding domain